jgi:hemerythrin superfamily protein
MPTKADQKTSQAKDSALSLLQQDHREVEAFFEEFETTPGDQAKEALALKICLALQVHAQIEEEIFYPAVRDVVENRELLDEAIVEHAAAKQLIAEIESMEVGDQLREAKVKVLGEQIRHHVQEEENELFPQVQDGKLDLDSLGREMASLKQELLKEVADGGEPMTT